MVNVIIYLSFINTYTQTFRSSTIEPFFESLPDHLSDVNARTSFVIVFQSLDIATGFR